MYPDRQPSTVCSQPEFIYKFHSYKNGFYNCLTKTKRPFPKPISFFKKGLRDLGLANLFIEVGMGLALLFLMVLSLNAQTDCPTCEVQIPDSLQVDTFFLEEFPDGTFQTAYQGNVSFRLPTNTNEVLFLVPDLPGNIGLNSISIKSISNLPAGLIWIPSQENYDLPDERNGCVMICGRPLQFGLFEVDITVTAKISILEQDATFTRTLFIAPPSSDNSGFSMTNNIGCGNANVTFINNNPSNGKLGFSYFWDLGNGITSTEEQLEIISFDQPGVYPINYQVIVDTIGATLTAVEVVASDCDDILGRPDFYFRLYDAADTLVFESNSIDNTEPPVRFPLNLTLSDTSYRIEIWDGDSGLGLSDDSCGVFTFKPTQADTLQEEDLQVLLTILHTSDTIQAQDSVIVHPLPEPPIISLTSVSFCEGDIMPLTSSNTRNLEWFKDGVPIGRTDSILMATSTGEYHVSHTSIDGCVVFSEPVFLETIVLPDAPVFSNTDNVLKLFNPNILPLNYELRWFQEGNLLEETGMELCVSESGNYRLQLINTDTECASSFETVITINDQVDCTTSVTHLSNYLENFSLYPNPTSDIVTINFYAPEPMDYLRLTVLNSLGQSILEENHSSVFGDWQIPLNLSAQVKGLYWVVLESERGVSSWKVVKR